MLKQLLRKEFRLALHPVNVIFLALSAMLLIPNYPYYVVFFYTSLGLFFACLTARENHDVEYAMLLPVSRRQVVRARLLFALAVEGAQLLACVPFAILSQRINRIGNLVGMDANIAFFGLSLVVLGVFNAVFFTLYFRNPARVGVSFVISSVVEAGVIVALELMTHKVLFFRRYLDTRDTVYLPQKLLTLLVCALLFAALNALACALSERAFEKVDL